MERMGFVDSVWVCSLDEFKGSVSLLRQSLITTQKAVQKEDNKADKMSLLYSYLTGNEFAMQLGTIVDGFIVMQEEFEKEKRSLMVRAGNDDKNLLMVYLPIPQRCTAHAKVSLEMPYRILKLWN